MLVSCNDISTSIKSPATLFVNACSKKKKKKSPDNGGELLYPKKHRQAN